MMNDRWFNHWVPGVMIDSQLWHEALVVDHMLESLWGSEQRGNNVMMWTLLQQGVLDLSGEDCSYDRAMCSMQYFVVLGCCLWGFLASEHTRVSLHVLFLFVELIIRTGTTIWNGS